MSESSESLHLWQTSVVQARANVVAIDLPARIVTANARWTTVVPFENAQVLDCVSAMPGLTLHWRFFGDFGLGAEIRDLIANDLGDFSGADVHF